MKKFFVRSKETALRLKRTLLQTISGGALGGVFSALVIGPDERRVALISAGMAALGVFFAAWAQNTINDVQKNDPRSSGE